MDLTLHVWRQAGPDEPGKMVTYTEEAQGISPDMSFLEMLDIVNERLIEANKEPIAFEHDCREGICGSCGMMINGRAHGPEKGTARPVARSTAGFSYSVPTRHFSRGFPAVCMRSPS